LATETLFENAVDTWNNKRQHLEENMAAAAVVLDEDTMAELNAVKPGTTDHQP